METPIYLFTGFLEAGKTKLIKESLADSSFNEGEKTLLILCEEGELEYDDISDNISVCTVENEEELTREFFQGIVRDYEFERVVVEYNGMWRLDSFYMAIPEDWLVYQEISVADSETFELYNQNMRALVADKLKSADVIIFNRVSESTDKELLHRIVRGLTTKTGIVYEYTDGAIENDTIEDPLPFDIESDNIVIEDKDYAIWYRDLVEHQDKYKGRRVTFKGIIAKDPKNRKSAAVIGRHVMTCCADDISYQGLIFVSKDEGKFNTRDWATVTGTIELERHALYNGAGPVLYCESIAHAKKPEEEIATYY